MKSKYKTIGILGGMGPEATADLYMKIIRSFQVKFGAKYDSDFPPIVVYSLPLPDVVEEKGTEQKIIETLVFGVRKLQQAGANFIVIPCNTVHIWMKEMRESVQIPILSIAEEVCRFLKSKSYTKVGLLSTGLTNRKRVFDRECEESNVELLKTTEAEQQKETQIIMAVLEGKVPDKEELQLIFTRFSRQKAQAIILGCTDLPLIVTQDDSDIEIIDTTQVLAKAAVRECQQNLFKQTSNDDK